MKRTYCVVLTLEIEHADPAKLPTADQVVEMLDRGDADSVVEQWVTDLWCAPPFNLVERGLLRLKGVAEVPEYNTMPKEDVDG